VTDKELKALLKERMAQVLVPHLQSLGFKPFNGRRGFTTRYVRERDRAFDMILIWWDKYGRPRFIFEFCSAEHPNDLVKIALDRAFMWKWNGSFRAGNSSWGEKWFKVRRPIFRSIHAAVDRVAESACARASEISAFQLGGEPSRYLYNSGDWSDRLLGCPEFLHRPQRSIP
jgi:hypothetical protein